MLAMLSQVVAAAPSADQLSPLDFGVIAVTDNASQLELELRPSGQAVLQPGLVTVQPGSPARFQFENFPPNTALSVTLDSLVLTAGGFGISEGLTVLRPIVTGAQTNNLGEALVSLGATLATSGTGGAYIDAPYLPSTAQVLIVEYWSPDEQAFVSKNVPIEIKSEVRSSIQLEELQSMSFGTLFARAGITDSASMRVRPNGTLAITEPGGSRLVSLSPPRPAVFRVSGAARNYLLNISLQSEDVELVRQQGSGPRFIVRNFESSPAGTGRTDGDGTLEIRVGATLFTETLPDGAVYPQGTYLGQYSVTVSY